MADKKKVKPVVVVPGITPAPIRKPPVPKPPTPGSKPPARRPPTPGIKPPAPGYYYYNDYGSDEVIQIILKKYCAVELLNALIIALGIVPPGKKGKGKGGKGGGGGGYPYGGGKPPTPGKKPPAPRPPAPP